jgi:hypothetical protein
MSSRIEANETLILWNKPMGKNKLRLVLAKAKSEFFPYFFHLRSFQLKLTGMLNPFENITAGPKQSPK